MKKPKQTPISHGRKRVVQGGHVTWVTPADFAIVCSSVGHGIDQDPLAHEWSGRTKDGAR